MRAIHMAYHHEPKVFEDPYAVYLTNDRLRPLTTNRFMHWLAMRKFVYGWTYPVQGEVLCRARYTEDRLEQALSDGIGQYVILGAGFDSFALRRPELLDTLAVFELDHPSTQQVKKNRLAQNGLEVPSSLTCVPIDMESESLSKKLLATSYSKGILSFFSLLGTVPYLTKQAFGNTLEEITACSAPGSLLVFDFADSGFFDAIHSSVTLKKLDRSTKRRGEPLITGFDIDELRDLLRDTGFDLVDMLSPEEQQERYFAERSDSLKPLEHVHLACAKSSLHPASCRSSTAKAV